VASQLGNVGYTMGVEYIFYVFFGLCLFSILSVLLAERLRVAGHGGVAPRTEFLSRVIYAIPAEVMIVARSRQPRPGEVEIFAATVQRANGLVNAWPVINALRRFRPVSPRARSQASDWR